MSQIQRDTYEGAGEVWSDVIGVIPRDNRNHRKKLAEILAHADVDPGGSVLEVGCGHGLHSPEYAERYDYVGVDLSSSLVAETRSRLDSGTVTQADATELPYGSDAFDAVVGTAILHHLEDQEAALNEWMRVANRSVTLMEPNYLFPKAFVSANLVPEERHKRRMAPWRLRAMLSDVVDEDAEWELKPRIYTPPWPRSAAGLFDWLDDVARQVPGARWGSQMLLIHVRL